MKYINTLDIHNIFQSLYNIIKYEKEVYIKQKNTMLNESIFKKIIRLLKCQGKTNKRIDILDKYISTCERLEEFNYILASILTEKKLNKISKSELTNLMIITFNYIYDINSYFRLTLKDPNNHYLYFNMIIIRFNNLEKHIWNLINNYSETKKTKSNFPNEVKKAFLELGLKSGDNVSASIIKKQYKKMAKIHHPDKGGCINKMQKINKAYTIAKSHFDNKK